eukprot:m.968699 g.968699  ORF g.968699 m.968699 type:complete len:207 (+) comp23918_c1_seq2:123-743(+)
MSSHESELAKKRAQLEDIKRRRQQRLEAKKLKKTGKNQTAARDDALDDLLGSLDLPKSEGGRRVVSGAPGNLSTTKNLLWPVSIPPVESVTYSKNVQTDPIPELEQQQPTGEDDLPEDPAQSNEQDADGATESTENVESASTAEVETPVKEEPKIVLGVFFFFLFACVVHIWSMYDVSIDWCSCFGIWLCFISAHIAAADVSYVTR